MKKPFLFFLQGTNRRFGLSGIRVISMEGTDALPHCGGWDAVGESVFYPEIQFWFSCEIMPRQNEHIMLTSSYNLELRTNFLNLCQEKGCFAITDRINCLSLDLRCSTWGGMAQHDGYLDWEDPNSIAAEKPMNTRKNAISPKKLTKFTGTPTSLPPFWSLLDSWWLEWSGSKDGTTQVGKGGFKMGGEPCVWCGDGFTPQCMVRQNCSF